MEYLADPMSCELRGDGVPVGSRQIVDRLQNQCVVPVAN